MDTDSTPRCGLITPADRPDPDSDSDAIRAIHSRAPRRASLTATVVSMAAVLLYGCGSTPSSGPRCDGNNFNEVTLKPGCSTICVEEPCRVLFEMPAGSDTLPVRVGNIPLGDFPSGERVFLGSFFVGGYIFRVEETDLPPAYLTVGTSSAQ
jgi:hypothetical protein